MMTGSYSQYKKYHIKMENGLYASSQNWKEVENDIKERGKGFHN